MAAELAKLAEYFRGKRQTTLADESLRLSQLATDAGIFSLPDEKRFEELYQSRLTIEGKANFDLSPTQRLRLLSFPGIVEEDVVWEQVVELGLRGVALPEWRTFLGLQPADVLQGLDFSIALMGIDGNVSDETRFAQTAIYHPRTNSINNIQNWTKKHWGPNIGFMFAQDISPTVPVTP